jgi:hypothetical protein
MHTKNQPVDNTKIRPAELMTLPLADLKDHPDQAKYFRSYGKFERKQLKADIVANGVRVPPEVIPPNNAAELRKYTILKGMTRIKIWAELGHEKIKVLVRFDLLTATREEIDKEFLLDNVARRQLDKLGQARAAVGLCVIERKRTGRAVCGDPLANGDVRERVGKIIGMSGRNLQRYLNVLSAPLEVQDAFQAGIISLNDASRVIGLKKCDQDAIASCLRNGEDAYQVFANIFRRGDGRHVKANDAVATFARVIEKSVADLDDRVESASPEVVLRHKKTFQRGKRLIRNLLSKLNSDE